MYFKYLKQFGVFFALANQVVVALVGGFLVGYWLDGYFKSFPWLTILCFLAGIISAINLGIFIVKKYKKAFTE